MPDTGRPPAGRGRRYRTSRLVDTKEQHEEQQQSQELRNSIRTTNNSRTKKNSKTRNNKKAPGTCSSKWAQALVEARTESSGTSTPMVNVSQVLTDTAIRVRRATPARIYERSSNPVAQASDVTTNSNCRAADDVAQLLDGAPAL
jgi:hypothetical protein